MSLFGGLAATLALAGAPPAAYVVPDFAGARAGARDVIVMAIAEVEKPAGPYGDCKVRGRITAVERGSAFQVGQTTTLRVACLVGPGFPPPGPRLWTDYAPLNDSLMIRAWTDGADVLLDQTEVWGRRP